MIFRLIVVAAGIVVLVALIVSCIKIGKKLGRAEARSEMSGLDVNTYHRLGNFVRSVLAPPATIDDFVQLPEYLKKEADELIKLIGPARRLVRRK